jgi:hypothetical protein
VVLHLRLGSSMDAVSLSITYASFNKGGRSRRGFEPCPRIGAIGDRQGRDAGTGPRQEGPQTANSRRDSYLLGVPPQASRGGARSGRTPEASDSTLARRVSRFQPLPRDPWQVSMNGNGSGQRLWNCLLGRTPWRHGDLRPLLFARGMIRADRSTTCPPDGVLAKDRSRYGRRTAPCSTPGRSFR